MSCLLPTDCLNEIFENLEDDKMTLHSCLLVNRLWCKASVRILWRDIWSFKRSVIYNRVASAILSTLVSCLPNESKELLCKNEIFISTPTSKPPLFNYVSFCKVLSINEIDQITCDFFNNDKSIASKNSKKYSLLKEMFKMFMNQISSLKMLNYRNNIDISFTSFPGAKDCLTDLSELQCSSIIHSEVFYGLSQICHNLQTLTIYLESEVSNALKELISSQNNLKNLELSFYGRDDNLADIIPTLTKHSNTLTKLRLFIDGNLPLSFVSSFLNLHEIIFSFNANIFENFKELQYVTFPKLQTLKFPDKCPKPEYLMKFLEINGKNLKEFYIYYGKASNLSIDKSCPNLKKLYVIFERNVDMLKIVLNSCQYLEGIVIRCGKSYLNEKEVFETIVKHSPKNFYELKLYNAEMIPENLESFFVSWKNRSKKSLNLIIVGNLFKVRKESRKIIEKYKNLGVIKKFETIRGYTENVLYL